MAIEEQITNLVKKYRTEPDRNQTEADIQAGYIDQLFLALGWNVYNEPGQLTNYRRQGYLRGAGIIDVGLEVAGEPALILEAKRFGVILRSKERTGDRTTEEKQLFRYARSRRIPFGVLTNFERLHVFNADHERLILAFDDPQEYLDRLPELLRLSPDKIKAGSLPAWERQLEIRDIDETFLASLQQWRLRLANAIYQNNLSNPVLQTDGQIDFDKLMAAVQRILDRLILVRFADDKEVLLTFDVLESILSYHHKLGAYAGREHLRQEFIQLSQIMDEHHNTTLFQPGHICEQVILPNETLAQIMEEMSNTSFRKFTSDILGNTYETYLGTKLVLKNGEIKSEARRDIRKAGGIFFTPPAIVHYIVDNTLGSLLKELETQHGLHAIEKTQTIKVLDPACGSGSFLIYAYQVLANFYRRINQQIEAEQIKLLAAGGGADMFQRLEQFKHLPSLLLDYPHHILKSQLYGVDIDPEAAEIATVNLTMQAFADSKREKLPLILGENIRVGNSLISGTEEELRSYFGDAWQEKKPFNWEEEFGEIMQGGGFDVVIGNPPYVQMSMEPTLELGLKRYLLNTFGFSMGRLNTFGFFIQRGTTLLKPRGFLSYIIPNTFLTQEYYRQLREFLLNSCQVVAIATLEEMPFKGAIVENVIVVLNKETNGKSREANNVSIVKLGKDEQRHIPQNMFSSSFNYAFTIQVSEELDALRNKIDRQSIRLFKLVNVNQAIALKHDRASCLFREPRGEKYKKVLDGRDISRYAIRWPGYYLLYDVEKIHSCKREDIFLANEKILFRRVGDTIIAALDTEQHYALNTLVVVTPKSQEVDLRFILTLMNSRLLNWYYKLFLKSTKKVFSEIQARQIEQLPVRQIDFNNPTDKRLHDDLVALVDRMLELNKRLAPIRNTACAEREELLRQIEQTDQEIDNLVYVLYGLTEEERKIVQEATKSQE